MKIESQGFRGLNFVMKGSELLNLPGINLQLLASEFGGVKINDLLRFGMSIAVIVLSLVYAHVKWLHVFNPVLVWLAEGFANFNEVIDWALVPVIGLIKLPWRLIQLSHRERMPEAVDSAPDSRQ